MHSTFDERHVYTDIVIEPLTASDIHKQLSENSRFLDYPRTLEINLSLISFVNPIVVHSIMGMIPRMANLSSLRIIRLPFLFTNDVFIPMFTTCLQQSSIEQLYLSHLYAFPLSVLSFGKNIKKLVLSDCTAKAQPISSSPEGLSLETLILSGNHNQDLHIWAKRRVTRLKSLGLRELSLDLDWTAFPDLLTACSNSLTTLHLDIEPNCSNTYFYDADRREVGYWINDGPELPFTLSELTNLTDLSIFALINASATSIDCALPEIIRLINTATAIKDVVLSFHCRVSDSITSLGRLDWSLLDRLQNNFVGTRPRIHLCITGETVTGCSFSPKSVLDALATNEVLMDLIKRGLVIIKLERPLALWEES